MLDIVIKQLRKLVLRNPSRLSCQLVPWLLRVPGGLYLPGGGILRMSFSLIHFLLTILINSAYWRRHRPREGRNSHAAHPVTMEMPAILGTNLKSSGVDSTWFNENAASVPILMHYFISFIQALDPNKYRYESAPVWDSWGSGAGAGEGQTGAECLLLTVRPPERWTNALCVGANCEAPKS